MSDSDDLETTGDDAADDASAGRRGLTRKISDKLPREVPLPSSNPSTNLLIADIVVRGASTLFRKNVQRHVARASADSEEGAQEALDGRTMLTTLGLYGASKLATRSVPGLMVVTGGLVLKTLYDRGKARQQRKRREHGGDSKGEDSEG